MPATVHHAPWAARLALSLAPSLDALRQVAGLEGCIMGSWLWVRGVGLAETHQRQLERVPWFNRYEIRDPHWLFEAGLTLPAGKLPAGPWRPLAELLVPIAPGSALPGELRGRALLEMHRSEVIQPAALLMVPMLTWYEYALAAPAVRLNRLSFVLNETQGQALIRGTPLPPLSGRQYYFHGPAVFPCGLSPVPALHPATFAAWLDLKEDELALFDEDGTHARIPADLWCPADRSVIRSNCAPPLS